MSPTPGRGNLRATTPPRNVLTRRESETLRPAVERLAGLGRTYKEIAAALSTPQVPLNARQVRGIQYKYGIPSGARAGRRKGTRVQDEGGNARRIAALAAARAKVRPLLVEWIAARLTDRQMADLLNERGIPTLSDSGSWTQGRVEALRQREGLKSNLVRPTVKHPHFSVPKRHEAHCNTCDAPIHYDFRGNAREHVRLTSMRIAGVLVTGRCEGSLEPVVVRPLHQYDMAAAA